MLKFQVFARDLVGDDGFCVESEDGVPITGFVPPNTARPMQVLVLVRAGVRAYQLEEER